MSGLCYRLAATPVSNITVSPRVKPTKGQF